MDPVDKYSDIIANYLYKDMTEEERLAFEEELKVNIELANEFERQKEIIDELRVVTKYEEIMSDEHLDEAEAIARKIVQEMNEGANSTQQLKSTNKKPVQLRTFLSAAAAAILILIVSAILFINPNPEKLYQQFYTPFNSSGFINRSGDSSGSEISTGITSYFVGNYDLAIENLAAYENDASFPSHAGFILGLSYIGAEDYSRAIAVFLTHMEQHFSLMSEVKWYLALCYLQQGEYNKALELTKELSQEDGTFGKNAQKLTAKLERVLE